MEAMTHDSAEETAPEPSARALDDDSPGLAPMRILFQPRVEFRTGRPVGCQIVAPSGDGDERGRLAPACLPAAVAALTGSVATGPAFRVGWRAPPSLPGDFAALQAIEDAAALATAMNARLFVEAPECDLAAAPDRWAEVLAALRARGVGIAFADFGDGFLRATRSGGAQGLEMLEAIARMPCDEIQIAQNLAENAPTDQSAAAALRACVEFAHELGRAVAGTWVARPHHARLARDFGLDFGQGAYFSEPLDRDAFAEWLARRLRVFGDMPSLAPLPVGRRGAPVGA